VILIMFVIFTNRWS